VVGGDGGHIGGGSPKPVDQRNDRLLLRRGAHCSVERLSTACRAAAGIDVEEDGLDPRRLGGGFD
jgi:hypothetical protein